MQQLSNFSVADLKAMENEINEKRKILIDASQPEQAIELETQLNYIKEEISNRMNEMGSMLKS